MQDDRVATDPAEVREALTELRGSRVCVFEYPGWYLDGVEDSVMRAYVPSADGSVASGIY